jgi:hypothetical protein
MKRTDKAIHAAERMAKRFGVKLDDAAHTELCGMIKNCKWVPISVGHLKVKARLEFRGQEMEVVFSPTTNIKIVTVIGVDRTPPPKPVVVEKVVVCMPEKPKLKPTADPKCPQCHGSPPDGMDCSECEDDG